MAPTLSTKVPLPIGVLVSGEGTTLEAIATAIDEGRLAARIALVVSDRPARAIERAKRRGLPVVELPPRGKDPPGWVEALDGALRTAGAELVVLAGFLSVLPPEWLARWHGRAINLHPSLLPRHGGRGLYGPRVHAAVLESGDRETGATVHLVTADVDRGPILAQERVAVGSARTPEELRTLVAPIERRLLVETIQRFADGALPLPYR